MEISPSPLFGCHRKPLAQGFCFPLTANPLLFSFLFSLHPHSTMMAVVCFFMERRAHTHTSIYTYTLLRVAGTLKVSHLTEPLAAEQRVYSSTRQVILLFFFRAFLRFSLPFFPPFFLSFVPLLSCLYTPLFIHPPWSFCGLCSLPCVAFSLLFFSFLFLSLFSLFFSLLFSSPVRLVHSCLPLEQPHFHSSTTVGKQEQKLKRPSSALAERAVASLTVSVCERELSLRHLSLPHLSLPRSLSVRHTDVALEWPSGSPRRHGR